MLRSFKMLSFSNYRRWLIIIGWIDDEFDWYHHLILTDMKDYHTNERQVCTNLLVVLSTSLRATNIGLSVNNLIVMQLCPILFLRVIPTVSFKDYLELIYSLEIWFLDFWSILMASIVMVVAASFCTFKHLFSKKDVKTLVLKEKTFLFPIKDLSHEYHKAEISANTANAEITYQVWKLAPISCAVSVKSAWLSRQSRLRPSLGNRRHHQLH